MLLTTMKNDLMKSIIIDYSYTLHCVCLLPSVVGALVPRVEITSKCFFRPCARVCDSFLPLHILVEFEYLQRGM